MSQVSVLRNREGKQLALGQEAAKGERIMQAPPAWPRSHGLQALLLLGHMNKSLSGMAAVF